jgi:nitroreductase
MKDEVLNMQEYIVKRKSIRKFDMKLLDAETINDINKYIENIESLDSSIKTKTYILNDERLVSGFFKVKAPQYIAITSEKKEGYLINAGYILEQLVIYLTSKGIGTCWLGGVKPNAEISSEDLGYVVMIAIGKPNEPLYRKDASEFKRKDISEISNLREATSIMEAVRLAPSASNQQAWYFDIKENEIYVYCKKVMKLMEKMANIDIGIALAHIHIVAQDQGKKVEMLKEEDKLIQGYEYIVTCKIV